ncbi:MAG: hypothetical protein ACHQZR_05720 [Candidatus Limnocylindrales bacterium]
MPALALLAAAAAIAGAAVAVSTSDARLAVAGTWAALLVAPFVTDPLPPPLGWAVRVVASGVAGYLLWAAVRGAAPLLAPPRLGGQGEAAFVIAGGLVGLLADGVTSEALGPTAALAAGLSLLVAGGDLLAFADDGLRLGCGALLALTGASLVLTELGGTPAAGLEAAIAVATLAFAGTAAWLTVSTLGARGELRLGARHGDLRDIA